MSLALAEPTLSRMLTDWQLEPGPTLAGALAACLYVAGVRRAARWPAWRSASFLAGVAAALLALCSGLDTYADTLLTLHMVQHLLLTMLAAPLIVAASPVALALRALPGRSASRRGLLALLRSRPLRALASPPVAWLLFTGTTLATHLTGFYSLALRHDAVHSLEHALYLGTALLFWVPLLDADPLVSRPLGLVGRSVYLLAAMPAMAFVGAVMSFSDHPLYAEYVAPARALGRSALSDQKDAGALMWVGGKLAMALLLLVSAWLILRREERRARAREAHAPAPGRRVAGGSAR
ncbi:MAG: cytochrome c oxidase assembly protein [Thermoleophilaceae bacterium]|nr:cytochrome c oxidase assembly protein [Thermoleophilaceae bacterium]